MKKIVTNVLIVLGIIFLGSGCSSTVKQQDSLTDYANDKINPFLNGSNKKVDIYIDTLKNISITKTGGRSNSMNEMRSSTLPVSKDDLTKLSVNFMKQFYTPKAVSNAQQVKNGFLISMLKADANVVVSETNNLTERVFTNLKIKIQRMKNFSVIKETIVEVPMDESIGDEFRKVEYAWAISNHASFNMLPTKEKIKQMTALSMHFALDKLQLNKQ